MKFNSPDTAKVKMSNVKVTRSTEICAQKHQIYAGNVIG